jgi:GNAT superfamily N-acetyltransferase
MSFRRGLEPVERRPTALRLVRVGAAEARDFGRIVVTGYGLPAAAAPWAAEAPNLGWDCWLALDGDEPAAAAGVFMAEGVGYLGFAATLPEHRGMGGQNALLAERIDHAREAGCDVVVTETGELREELPSATSSGPASRRWRCVPTGSGRCSTLPPRARRIRSRASAAGGSEPPSGSSG